jgi:hypothetical protein
MFTHDNLIQLPELIQRNLKTGRVYQVASGAHTGKVYPSITRVLKAKEQDGLKKWKKRVGEAEAAKVSARATLQGTTLHTLCERYLANLDLPTIYPHVQQLWKHIQPWLAMNIVTVYQQEANLFSDRLGVAGRTDLLANVRGHDLTVVDFKSANREKKKDWIEDYFIQGTFYSAALYELTGHKAKRIILPIIHPDGLQLEETTPMKHFDGLIDRITLFYETFDPTADANAAEEEPETEPKPKCPRCGIADAGSGPDTYCDICLSAVTKSVRPCDRPATFKKIA